MHVMIDLPESVERAANVETIRARAMDRGIADLKCACGRDRTAGRSTWHLYCPGVVELLIEDLDRASALAENLQLRGECAHVAAMIREELERPLEEWERGRRLVDAIGGRTGRPKVRNRTR